MLAVMPWNDASRAFWGRAGWSSLAAAVLCGVAGEIGEVACSVLACCALVAMSPDLNLDCGDAGAAETDSVGGGVFVGLVCALCGGVTHDLGLPWARRSMCHVLPSLEASRRPVSNAAWTGWAGDGECSSQLSARWALGFSSSSFSSAGGQARACGALQFGLLMLFLISRRNAVVGQAYLVPFSCTVSVRATRACPIKALFAYAREVVVRSGARYMGSHGNRRFLERTRQYTPEPLAAAGCRLPAVFSSVEAGSPACSAGLWGVG